MTKLFFPALLVASLWVPSADAQNPATGGDPFFEVSLVGGSERLALRVTDRDEQRPPKWCVIMVTSETDPIVVASGPPLAGVFTAELPVPPEALEVGFTLRGAVVDAYGGYELTAPVTVGDQGPVVTEKDPADCHQPGGILDRIHVQLIPTDSIPPQYSVLATFESDSDGYALWRGDVVMRNGVTDVYLVLKTPDPDAGEGFLDIAELLRTGAHLGAYPGELVRVWAAETKQRVGDLPLQYRTIATFEVGAVAPTDPVATDWLNHVRLELISTDSIPPEFTLVASFEAISDDFGLHVQSVARRGENTDVFLVLKEPGPGEGLRDVVEWHLASVPLGLNPGQLRVFGAQINAYGPNEGQHEFRLLRAFAAGPEG